MPWASAPSAGLSVAPADARFAFEHVMEGWGTITYVLNSLNRGLGQADAYPFVLSATSMTKLL